MTTQIPVFKPYIGVDTLKAITDSLDIGWLGMGSFVKEFEDSIANYLKLNNRYVVAVNTGTSALHLALLIAGVGPGDEVITPSVNNIADFQAILAAGAEPVLCDINDDVLGIDCAKAESLLSPKTKAIIGMDYAGIPCDLEALYDFARHHKLRVIHDASHSFGSEYKGRLIGSFGDVVTFSFDPVKTLTCIDGGALVVNSKDDVEKLHHYRLLGMTQSSSRLYSNNRAWTYDVVSKGFRYHLSNIHASIGISQLKKLPEFVANRRDYCRHYSRLLHGTNGIRLPQTDFDGIAPFIYYIRVEDGKRAELIERLRQRGVDTGIHWIPGHNFTLLREYRRSDMTVTDRVGDEILTLPLHSYMNNHTIETVAQSIREFAENKG